MYLTHLSLTNFRNFARLDIDVPLGSVLIVGSNGQGKTSLLEAIYFLSTVTSFHAQHDRELLNFLAAREPLAVGRIVARFHSDGSDHRIEIRLIQESNGVNGSTRLRKEIILDGLKLKINEVLGKFMSVLFLPHMVEIIVGSPEERRRFFNLAMSQVINNYGQILSDYNQALSQRNALLKRLGEIGGDTGQLVFWDELLAAKGAMIIHARIRAIRELERLAARQHRELTPDEAMLRFEYQPAFDPLPQSNAQFSFPLDVQVDRSSLTFDQIQQGFQNNLAKLYKEDIARGVTTIGPHRDDFRFLENGIDLGTYGSRGQVRTVMLSLKLAELEWMKEKTNDTPVLLLDEALAELDPARRIDLLDRIHLTEQTLMTTTDMALFSQEFVDKAIIWQISNGRLIPAKQP
jgi:DNA replication and repair protein RecF